jgi:hypothetical protein
MRQASSFFPEKFRTMKENKTERAKRLNAIVGTLELALGPSGFTCSLSANPATINQLISLVMRRPSAAKQVVCEIGERWNKGTRPKPLSKSRFTSRCA